ncbi:hypothetical protein, partial [Sansalvadorimonas verongulae]|uniref:hypothetical protein n=1 Tax=Sansalvadorimonas verongulae TaxID=2172824 RepID=UPI0018AD2F38
MDITPNHGKNNHDRQAQMLFRPSYSSGPKLYTHRAQGSTVAGSADNSERRQLSGYRTQPHSGPSHIQSYPDIDHGFRLLKTDPQKALDEAEKLLKKYVVGSRQYARIVQLKSRSLFLLDNFCGCIEYINSLSEDLQNNKGVIMAKGRALQAQGHLTEALPLFRKLYEQYSASANDEKINGLA